MKLNLLRVAFLAFALVVPAGVEAYEVSVHYPTGSIAVGPVSVIAEVRVTITQADLPLSSVEFEIDWGCDGGVDGCLLFHGYAILNPGPNYPFPFQAFYDPYPCFGITCECLSGARYRSNLFFPVTGTFVLGYLTVSRMGEIGVPGDCHEHEYPEVVVDWGCIDDPKCSGSGTFTVLQVPLAVENRTWGAVKSMYR